MSAIVDGNVTTLIAAASAVAEEDAVLSKDLHRHWHLVSFVSMFTALGDHTNDRVCILCSRH